MRRAVPRRTSTRSRRQQRRAILERCHPYAPRTHMNLITTAVAFIVTLGLLIIVHELGHYCVARLCNVKVLRFSVGFGRPIWTRTQGPDRTEWSISTFPLGGYVKML